jgi:hypothetical protein
MAAGVLVNSVFTNAFTWYEIRLYFYVWDCGLY